MELIGTFLFNALAFIFIISVIVFVHEFGHYFVAKISGVRVEAFSVGFGKEIYGRTDKSGTRWKVCLIPFGGYVKMFGDIGPTSAPDKGKIKKLTAKEKKLAFHTKSLPVKAAIVSAGPIANFLLAIIILTFFYMAWGRPITLPEVTQVLPDSAAEEAGLKAGDLIVEMDGDEVKEFLDIQRLVKLNTGRPINMVIKRDDKYINKVVTPRFRTSRDAFGNEVSTPLIGISSQTISNEELKFTTAFGAASIETYNISISTLKAISQIATGKRDIKQMSGPLGIAKYSGDSARNGFKTVLWFIVVLSINLGLINLFPIPALDGGHLLYYTIEAVQGEPLAEKYQEYGIYIGISLIFLLLAFTLINDIRKFILAAG